MSYQKLHDFRNKLNSISPSFCVAKWKQVTVHLQTGHTHSCHHPTSHKIPLAEIAEDPSALHNTRFKKLQRRSMLLGHRPAECDYCWRVEDSNPDAFSDRIYKSADKWARESINEISTMPWDANVVPSYLEVSFSNVCNFKCSYCAPQYSSKWMDEIDQYGPFPTSKKLNSKEYLISSNSMPISHKEENPYVDAFWKWWPSIYNQLKIFRITGGEPLLSKDLFKVLDYIIANPNQELELAINSNLCPPTELFNKFIEKIKTICDNNLVKSVKIFTSCDTYGKQAEYIRHGLDYNEWITNVRRVIKEISSISVTVMSTYNFMSIFSYSKFLEDIVNIKKEFGDWQVDRAPILIDTPYLRHPDYQSIFIIPPELKYLVKEHLDLMNANLESPDSTETAYKGFFKWETDKFSRIWDIIQPVNNYEVTHEQRDFIAFVDEHDARRGTNFLETFPEMEEWYYKWKN